MLFRSSSLGGILGLVFIEAYVVIFLLWDLALPSPAGVTGAHTMFLIILSVLILIKYYIWPELWVKRVLRPVLRTYFTARRNLIRGLHEKGLPVKVANPAK